MSDARPAGRNTMYVVDDLISSLLSGEAPATDLADAPRPATPPLPRHSAMQSTRDQPNSPALLTPSRQPAAAAGSPVDQQRPVGRKDNNNSSKQYGTLPSVPFKDAESAATPIVYSNNNINNNSSSSSSQYDALPVNPNSLANAPSSSPSSSPASLLLPPARRLLAPTARTPPTASLTPTSTAISTSTFAASANAPAPPMPMRRGSIPVPVGAPPRANLRAPPAAVAVAGSPPPRLPLDAANATNAAAAVSSNGPPPPPALALPPRVVGGGSVTPRRNSPIPLPPSAPPASGASAAAATMAFGTMTLPRHGQWTGDEVILTVNVPHIEATSKFKFRMDMLVSEAIDHIRDSLQKKGMLFGADLESAYTLFTLGGRGGGGTMRRTGSLFAMKSQETLGEYCFIPGDMLYFKPLFTPSAATVAPHAADADSMTPSASSSQPASAAPPVMRASFTQRAALPAPIADSNSLHQLAQSGDYARIQEVLAASRIAVDHQDVHGNTALMWAGARGHHDVVQQLLQAGASVDLQSKSGATALLYSARKGRPDCVRALIAAQANPNLRDATGNSPVSTASKNGHADIVRDLLAHGADVNARDTTALLWASKKGHLDIVRMLLAAGADKLVATAEGKTALDLARPHPAIVDVLRAWGPELVRVAPSEVELGDENTLVTVDIRNFGTGTTVTIDGVEMVTTELRRAPGDVVSLQFQAPPSDFPCFRHIELAHADGARCVAQRALRYGQPSQEATASLRIGKFDQDAGYVPPPLPPGGGAASSAPPSPRVPPSQPDAAPPPPPMSSAAPPPAAAPPARPAVARRSLSTSMRGPAPMRAPPQAPDGGPPDAPLRKVGSTPSLAAPGRALPPMPRGGSIAPPEPPLDESGPPPMRPQMPPPTPTALESGGRRPSCSERRPCRSCANRSSCSQQRRRPPPKTGSARSIAARRCSRPAAACAARWSIR
jgi:hypothetical protein